MAMPIQKETTSMMDILNLIPVYPETTRLNANRKMALASELGICEDDKGRISWISEEAKKNAIEKRTLLKTQKTLPKQKLEKDYGPEKIPDVYKLLVERNSVKINQNAKNIEKIALVDKYTVADKVKEMYKILTKQKKFVCQI